MNIKYRESLNDQIRKFIAIGEWDETPRFTDIKRTITVGASMFYTAIAKADGRYGVKAGDLVYFKKNPTRGVNPNNARTDEARGSCEDIGEVLTHFTVKAMNEKIGDDVVFEVTPYDFAEYEDDIFWSAIAKETAALVKSRRIYGCMSPNCIDPNGEIIHGNTLIRCLMPNVKSIRSDDNTLYNYQMASIAYAEQAKEKGQEVLIHPKNSRADFVELMVDFMGGNGDRHCKNRTKQIIKLPDGRAVLVNTSGLDNGGALGLQSINCYNLFMTQYQKLLKDGKLLPYEKHGEFVDRSPFNQYFDFTIGSECFKDKRIANAYEHLSYEEQIVALVSQNKVLFNDFKNVYQHFDYDAGAILMKKHVKFSYLTSDEIKRLENLGRPVDHINGSQLPGMHLVAAAQLKMKREMLSKAMANVMGIAFDEELFKQNQMYYVDMFEPYVKENELTIHVASNAEIKAFDKQIEAIKQNAKQKQ